MDTWTPDKIKSFRQRLGLTQKAFGELVGVTRMYVIYLEKGVRTPGKTLCILFDCIKSKENEKGKVGDKRGKRHIQKG
jgi:DNA-binding XRE family transcriptional regulator